MYKIFEETQFIGKQIIYLPKCRSTNDIAADMYKRDVIKEGAVIITDHQYAGRGQHGNYWVSDPKQNLTFSIILKPDFLESSENFYLNVFSSIAIINALKEYDRAEFIIKWPNDLMYIDHKIGGILIENTIQSNRIVNTILGIGININQTKFSPLLRATSMKSIFDIDFETNDIFNRVIFHLEKSYLQLKTNKNDLRKLYQSNLYWLNEEHTFKSKEKFRGVILGIDDYGRLKVNSKGLTNTYNFKEITYLE